MWCFLLLEGEEDEDGEEEDFDEDEDDDDEEEVEGEEDDEEASADEEVGGGVLWSSTPVLMTSCPACSRCSPAPTLLILMSGLLPGFC